MATEVNVLRAFGEEAHLAVAAPPARRAAVAPAGRPRALKPARRSRNRHPLGRNQVRRREARMLHTTPLHTDGLDTITAICRCRVDRRNDGLDELTTSGPCSCRAPASGALRAVPDGPEQPRGRRPPVPVREHRPQLHPDDPGQARRAQQDRGRSARRPDRGAPAAHRHVLLLPRSASCSPPDQVACEVQPARGGYMP